MDQICRLCLTVTESMACKLGEDTNVLDKLFCLNIQILINKLLPSLVCCVCSKTLDNIINYRENIIQNQYKLLEQLNNGKPLEEFYQNLKFRDLVKTENIDIDSSDPSNYHESEAINSTKKNESDQEDKNLTESVEDNIDTGYCESVIPKTYKRTNKTVQVKNLMKIKKDNSTHKKRTTRRNKESQTKAKTNQSKSKPTKHAVESKYDTELCIKVEKNISEEKSTSPVHTSSEETNSNNVENSTFTNNSLDLKLKNSKCLTCFRYLPSNSELIRHYRTIHSTMDKENSGTDTQTNSRPKKDAVAEKSERPYNCKVCGRTFVSVYAIVRHARAHSDYSLSCSHGCGYSTVYRGALLDHEKRHENNFRYKCVSCGAGFHVKTWYEQHQNIHKNVKPFVCDVCGTAFHMNRYLTSHRSSVHPELLKGVKRYVCPHCDLAFENARNFGTHLEDHRGKKKFLCALCGKECSTSEQLKRHNNSHLGIKPFACSICNKRFSKKFNLSVHQRAHAGEKHLCQECGKHFAQRSTLLRHARKCHPESKEYNNESKHDLNK